MLIGVSQWTKDRIDIQITGVAQDVDRCMLRCKTTKQLLDRLTDEDLTALGYDSTAISYIRSFGVACNNMYLMYTNQSKVGTDDPSYFVGMILRNI